MKILILSTSDSEGGAARCSARMLAGFQSIGVEAQMLVQTRRGDLSGVVGSEGASGIGQAKSGLRLTLDRLPLKLYKARKGITFSTQWQPDTLIKQIKRLNPDAINIHWAQAGFLQIETLAKLNKPIIWTLHDMWAFTGGCHYNQACDRYQENCGACPQLNSQRSYDLSRWIWNRKAKTFKSLDLTVVASSVWLSKCAQASSLFQGHNVTCIPTGLDTDTYRPLNRMAAREMLGLPLDKQLILFGSLNATSDRRKGFQLLQPALQKLADSPAVRDSVELVVFGSSEPKDPPQLGLPVHYLGGVKDDLSLAMIYSAADVFVLPSIQENLANTIMESLACGTPCVAFDIGGMPDMIDHQQNGYLARPYEVDDLAEGLRYTLKSVSEGDGMRLRSRQKVETEFPLALPAKRYLSLAQSVHQPQGVA